MLGFLHVIAIEAGAKIPIADCEAAPTGLIASLEAVPTVGWLQIMLTMCMIETGTFASWWLLLCSLNVRNWMIYFNYKWTMAVVDEHMNQWLARLSINDTVPGQQSA